MAALENKIDFVALISVTNANCNGDPTDGNRPRTDLNGRGEISTVCIKRKIRNRMQDMGHAIFLQPDDNRKDDCKSQRERADKELKGIKDRKTYAERRVKNGWMCAALAKCLPLRQMAKKGMEFPLACGDRLPFTRG